VGIVGVSGGGKSTLLKLISGLYDVQIGKISVMVCRLPRTGAKTFQWSCRAQRFFPGIRDNITCGHAMDEADIIRACHASQLTEWLASLPEGLTPL
jgi:ABC-type bacteriocin/lantibiotic exporter with double-glycine peptidase domain